MLKNLLKYELKATGKTFIPLYIAILLVACFNQLFLATELDFGSGITTLILVGLFVALGVMTLVVLIGRFNKNLLGDEGYLMFTLPVKPHQLILSKLLITIFWTIISGIVAIFTFMILITGFDFVFVYIGRFFANIGPLWQAFSLAMQEETFLQGFFIIVIFCFIGFFGYIGAVLDIYLALSIAQLPVFTKYRTIISFVAFFVINIVLQIITLLIGIILVNVFGMLTPDIACIVTLIGTIVIDITFFFAVNYILSKHLNLE